MRKYKYYLRKPKSEIAKDILATLFTAGVLMVAATSPYFATAVWKTIQKRKKYPRRKFVDTFTRLRKNGLLVVAKDGYDLKISLTSEGKKRAGYMQIDALRISQPKKWDKKWRLILFDISNPKTIHRNAFRGKLRSLGFLPLQKSVWVHPFDCGAEIELLRDFFGLREKEVRMAVAETIGNDDSLKKHWNL